jgi:hypothetical protein
MICGFCGEDEGDHAATLDLLRSVGYDQAFLFAYSRRDKTHAARHLQVSARRGWPLQGWSCTLCMLCWPPCDTRALLRPCLRSLIEHNGGHL